MTERQDLSQKNFTLTDEEREAIEVAAAAYAADHGERFAAVLRNLLERLHA
jgi:flagellar biosynthesis/type III secretory pathway M-ring protein FliF/YscJ